MKNIFTLILAVVIAPVIIAGLSVPSVAQAACAPQINIFKATPLEVSEEKPLVTVSVKLINLNTCTAAEKSNMIMHIRATEPGSLSLMNIPLDYAGSKSEYLAEQTGVDVLHINPDTYGKYYPPTIAYKAMISKKGRVTAIGDTVYEYPTKLFFKVIKPASSDASAAGVPTGSATASAGITNAGGYDGMDGKIPTIDSPVTGGATTLPELMGRIIQYALGLIAMVAIVVIILAGFRMIAGSGDENQRKIAKRSITWAIIGLVLALLSFSIVTIIQSVLYRQP